MDRALSLLEKFALDAQKGKIQKIKNDVLKYSNNMLVPVEEAAKNRLDFIMMLGSGQVLLNLEMPSLFIGFYI